MRTFPSKAAKSDHCAVLSLPTVKAGEGLCAQNKTDPISVKSDPADEETYQFSAR